jgi:hypothetical protein
VSRVRRAKLLGYARATRSGLELLVYEALTYWCMRH